MNLAVGVPLGASLVAMDAGAAIRCLLTGPESVSGAVD
jgi:hypothetical protein